MRGRTALCTPCAPHPSCVPHATLPEILLLVVCGTICDCDDYDAIVTNATIAQAILDANTDYLLAVKAMAASRSAGPPSRPRPTGSMADAASRVRRACPGPEPSSASPPAPIFKTIRALRHAISSRHAVSTPARSPKPSAPTGPSRTHSTGPSTSPSMTTSPASGKAREPPRWPSCATWHSISCAKVPEMALSSARKLDGNQSSLSKSSTRHRVNLDSKPCRTDQCVLRPNVLHFAVIRLIDGYSI